MTKLQPPEKSHPLFPSNPLSKLRSSEASFRKFGRKLNPSSPILQQKGPRGGGGGSCTLCNCLLMLPMKIFLCSVVADLMQVFANGVSFSLYGDRSSRPDVDLFCKKGVLRNFAKFTGRHLCQNLFFNKVTGLRPATLFKKRL